MQRLTLLNKKSIITHVHLILLSFIVVSCTTAPAPPTSDRAPSRQEAQPIGSEPVPKWEPISRAGNKSPYTVLGNTYYVMNSASGYQQSGIASWYGAKFHGRKTANGETYNMYAMTAAHKTLPIPSYVRVTNLQNNRSIIVRVNDRGPFHGNRLIDLSYAGAKKLGFDQQGTAEVEITAISPDNSSGPTNQNVLAVSAKNKLPSTSNPLYVQVGAFSNRQSAEQLKTTLVDLLNEPVQIQSVGFREKLYKVQIGPVDNVNTMQRILNILELAKIGRPLILDSI